ncbi:MAG: twin-arginine translocation signal domain-containing protein, partial [Planctomycetaceae bacterium]
MSFADVSRRSFLALSAAAAGSGLVVPGGVLAGPALVQPEDGLKGRIWKTLKIGMVQVKGSLTEKFAAVRDAGFDGIEMDAPGMNVEET